MNTQSNQTPNGIYLLNPEINSQQLFDTINAYLCKIDGVTRY
jgi:hypothetical protein